MRDCSPYFWFCLMFFSIAAAGCQSSEDTASHIESVASEPAEKPPATVDQPTPDKRPHDGESKPTNATVTAQFAPPFPERLELFEPPKRAQGNVRRDDESGDTVELKGFINVNQPRVVLSIDGVISPIAEGGEKYGVQVISIQPPTVVLQRGRSRWTATLE
jgi:hypothetical protein